MLYTGIFPNALKISKTIPLFKKGDASSMSNYRPISLLPTISKVFERVIYNQLYDYFNNNNLLAGQQYVFRAHHSTDVKLVDYINIQMDNGKIPVNIYLDLSKAFDTLDFKILLKKLEYYGIIGSAYNLLENYQVKREQYVNLRIIIQSKLKQNQESLKGPFLAHYCFVSTLTI